MPLCEALSSRRGRRPHHAHKDRVGIWDILRLTTGPTSPISSIAVARGRPREKFADETVIKGLALDRDDEEEEE
jgi:hypothetical protein